MNCSVKWNVTHVINKAWVWVHVDGVWLCMRRTASVLCSACRSPGSCGSFGLQKQTSEQRPLIDTFIRSLIHREAPLSSASERFRLVWLLPPDLWKRRFIFHFGSICLSAAGNCFCCFPFGAGINWRASSMINSTLSIINPPHALNYSISNADVR